MIKSYWTCALLVAALLLHSAEGAARPGVATFNLRRLQQQQGGSTKPTASNTTNTTLGNTNATSSNATSTNATNVNGTSPNVTSLNATNFASVWEFISNSRDYTNLTALVNATNSTSMLNNSSLTATLLLPTDDAFTLLMEEMNTTLAALVTENNGTYAQDILLYHLYPDGALNLTDINTTANTDGFLDMANNLQVHVSYNLDNNISISDVLGRGTVLGDLGVLGSSHLYSLSRVLIPEHAATLNDLFSILAGHFSYYLQAISAVPEFTEQLNSNTTNITVFVPYNQAWIHYADKANTTVEAMLNNATIVKAIVEASIYSNRSLAAAELAAAPATQRYNLVYPDAAVTAAYNAANFAIELLGTGSLEGRDTFVINPDLVAANSTVHGLDLLLIPEDIISYDYDY